MTIGTAYYYKVIAVNAVGNGPPSNEASVTFALSPSGVAVAGASGSPGQTVMLSATLTSGGAGVSGETLTFQVDGTSVGTGVTNAAGIATYGYAVSASASLGNHGLTASFAGDSLYGASSGTGTLTLIVAASTTPIGYRVDAGSAGSFTDSRAALWAAQGTTVSGGADVTSSNATVSNVPAGDVGLYRTQRAGASFTYTLTAPNGNYLLALLFAEVDGTVTGAGQRLCTVKTPTGQALLNQFDTFAAVGTNAAVTQAVTVTVTGGTLMLTFTGSGTHGSASVAALQLGLIPSGGGVTPFIPGLSQPVADAPAPGWGTSAIPTDGSSDSGGSGPSMGGPVSLASGVEENSPGPDLWAYNSIGPAANYERLYRSQRPNGGMNYGSPGLSPGWTDDYDTSATFAATGTGLYTLHFSNDGTDLWTGTTGSLMPQNQTAGTPYLLAQTPAAGAVPAFLTMTAKDRSQTTFTQIGAAGGNYAAQTYLLSKMTNLVRHSVTINRDTAANGYRVLSVTNDASPPLALLTFTYTGSHLAAVTDKDGRTITYGFNGGGSLFTVSQMNAAAAVRWQYGYIPARGSNTNIPALVSVQAPDPSNPGSLSSPSLSTSYDITGAIATHVDALGNQRAYTYTLTGGGTLKQLTGIAVISANGKPAEVWQEKIGANNAVVGTVDAAKNFTATQYQGPYLPSAVMNENKQTAQASYDGYGNPTYVTSPRGVQIKTTFLDPGDFKLGQPTQVQQRHIPYTPGTLPDPLATPDGLLTPTVISYYTGTSAANNPGGAFNGLVSEVDTPAPDLTTSPGGTPALPTIKTTFAYDPTLVGNSPLGNVLTTVGPGPNSPTGATVTYAYASPPALGEPLTVTASGLAPDGSTTAQATSYTYDGRGNTLSVTDALGNTTQFAYNLADQTTSVIYPGTGSGSAHTDTTYQYLGGPASAVIVYDENNAPVREVDTAYDPEGQTAGVKGSTQPATYAYDGRGRVVAMTDGNSRTTTYGYDTLGNLTGIYYPGWTSGQRDSETYAYDPAHNLTVKTDGRGVTTAYSYIDPSTNYLDPENLLYAVTYGNVPAGVTQIAPVTYAYDIYGRQTNMADGNGATTGSYAYAYGPYDDLGNLRSQTVSFPGGPQNQTMAWTHNPDGSRSALTIPGNVTNPVTAINGGNFSYTYDGLNRLTQLNVPFTQSSFNGTSGDYLSHSYYANGWLGQTNNLRMGSGSKADASTQATYTYNPRGFLTKLVNNQYNGSSSVLALQQTSQFDAMSYDAVGNRLGQTNTVPLSNSAPDASRQIVYNYDTIHAAASLDRDVMTGEASTLVGSGSGVYNDAYTNNFNYDAAYNPTSFAMAGAGLSFPVNLDNQILSSGFAWDGAGNPSTYQAGASTFTFDPEDRLTAVPAMAFTAQYDADGLRIKKTDPPIATTWFLYDEDTPVVEEQMNGGSASLYALNVTGADGWRAREYVGTQFFYGFSFDPEGNAVSRQNSGDVLYNAYATSTFEAYGNRGGDVSTTSGANPAANQQPARFGGQYGYYTDYSTGLLCLTHRYYDPGTGKFISRDPIGYAGGMNLYGFADGNPVNEIDPNGTDGFDNFCNAFTGAGDVISGGLTRKFRQHFGYDDVVDTHSNYYHGGQIVGVAYLAVDTVVGGVGIVNGVRAIRAAGGIRAAIGVSAVARATRLGLPRQVRAGGAVHVLEDAKTLVVTETHAGILNVFKRYNGGRLNLTRRAFWSHVLPHQHTYSLGNPPAKLNANWRTTFQKAGAAKTTRLWRP